MLSRELLLLSKQDVKVPKSILILNLEDISKFNLIVGVNFTEESLVLIVNESFNASAEFRILALNLHKFDLGLSLKL